MNYDFSIDYRLVSYKENWSFTPIWKNATHTIFETFSKNFPDIRRARTGHQIHSFAFHLPNSDDLAMLHKDSDEYLSFVKNSFNFVCLRDPYKRFISNFYDKIVLNPNGKEGRDFLKKYNVNDVEPIKKLKIFLKYVEANKETLDPHFWTQTKLSGSEMIQYDHVVLLENIEFGWKLLESKFTNVPSLISNKKNQSGSQDFAKIVSNDPSLKSIYQKIKMIYLDDYKLLESFSK